MSKSNFGSVLVLSAMASVWVTSASAQGPAGLCGQCANAYSHQMATVANPSVPCQHTALTPVINTQYQPQQTITYEDVPQIQYRREAHIETVPKTVYQTVTVDEGSYQTVWVSKPVAKQVPRTVYQQQVSYRSVPYQLTCRIPRVSTRWVPRQTLSYLPTTYQAVSLSPWYRPLRGVVSPAFTQPPATTETNALANPTVAMLPAIAVPSQSSATSSSRVVSESDVTAQPIPDPKFSTTKSGTDLEWTIVQSRRSRTATSNPQDGMTGFEIDTSRSPVSPRRTEISSTTSRKFVPVPSAATVWQSRQATRWR